ncbi:MAG: hypothetical protein ACFCD0_02525 [Gemmataceae bacterium]
MNPFELAFGIVVVVVILVIASFFVFRQLQTFQRVAEEPMSEIEQNYLRARARRRLLGSGLMVVLAGLLVGSYFLEGSYQELIANVQARKQPNEKPKMAEYEKQVVRRFTMYWIVALLVLLAFAILAALDGWATIRYWHRHQRQLRQQHHAELEEQLQRLRHHGNGRG